MNVNFFKPMVKKIMIGQKKYLIFSHSYKIFLKIKDGWVQKNLAHWPKRCVWLDFFCNVFFLFYDPW
jgi:hypothetical protein